MEFAHPGLEICLVQDEIAARETLELVSATPAKPALGLLCLLVFDLLQLMGSSLSLTVAAPASLSPASQALVTPASKAAAAPVSSAASAASMHALLQADSETSMSAERQLRVRQLEQELGTLISVRILWVLRAFHLPILPLFSRGRFEYG